MAITLANLALGGIFLYGLTDGAGAGAGASQSKRQKVDIYRQRDMHGLSNDTRDIIELITFSDNTDPVGSFKYKAHKYPGDIDIFEPVKICCTKDTATKKIAAELRDIAKKVKASKGTFWGDFKAGLDLDLKPEPGQTVDEYRKQALKVGLNRQEVDRAVSDFPESAREFYVVRWSNDDTIRGNKPLKSGKILRLEEAVTHDAMVKLDLWAPVNGNYTEITNFFLFIMQDKTGNETVLNAELGDRLESLNHDIQKYGSPEHWNPLKLSKRLWNKALFTKDRRLTDKLYPLFSSGAAQLNQIIGESETLRFMFERLSPTELDRVRQKLINQIHGFKRRINDVHDISLGDQEVQLYAILDRAAAGAGNSQTIGMLLEMEDMVKELVDDYSERFLGSIGIRP